MILLGVPRMTLDIDLLVPDGKRSQWLDLMRELGFRLSHGTEVFAQFQPGAEEMAPVDLMFVDAGTWNQLETGARSESIADQRVKIPRPEHLVALKLHAAASPGREAKEQDWEDIRRMVQTCRLDPGEPYFREIILSHGGQESLRRIQGFYNESQQ